jgi:hypothetical protein
LNGRIKRQVESKDKINGIMNALVYRQESEPKPAVKHIQVLLGQWLNNGESKISPILFFIKKYNIIYIENKEKGKRVCIL